MPLVTLTDCAGCPVRRICSAHVPDGEWEHDTGKDPCRVVTPADAEEYEYFAEVLGMSTVVVDDE